MKIPIYQVDTFTGHVFSGNPAAVCLLDSWLADNILLDIAAENNLSETAFVVKKNDLFHIRWFTPKVEIDLCGHATLASGFVLFENNIVNGNSVVFESKSGSLAVERRPDGLLSMIFPARRAKQCEPPDLLVKALGAKPAATLSARDLLVIFDNEEQVKNILPNFDLLSKIQDYLGVIISAQGDKADFVSRFFAPNVGITEDPVTGSSHCTLIPYWAERLKKDKLHALQISPRGGELFCENRKDQVVISGNAALYMQGDIFL